MIWLVNISEPYLLTLKIRLSTSVKLYKPLRMFINICQKIFVLSRFVKKFVKMLEVEFLQRSNSCSKVENEA